MELLAETLPETLQQVRKSRRVSQLELSFRVGVSQRHISFVESGRSQPSRELLAAWLQELNAPLVVRNAAMLQAGYAPAYSQSPLTAPELAQANEALVQLLRAHDPMPALVLDAEWNVLHMNRGAQWLAATLMPWVRESPIQLPINMLDLLLHPEGFAKPIVNLHEVGPVLLSHLRQSIASAPAIAAKVEAFAEMLRTRIGSQATRANATHAAPVLSTRFATEHGELAFFSMFTTFGTPHDITLASLRVEHMFAADESTRRIVQTAQSAVVKNY
jgi:transcriptional regulator with XRE-family HTH domain